MASAKGCNIPINPATQGPILSCILAKTFLSNNVKKATLIKAITTTKTKFIILFNIKRINVLLDYNFNLPL